MTRQAIEDLISHWQRGEVEVLGVLEFPATAMYVKSTLCEEVKDGQLRLRFTSFAVAGQPCTTVYNRAALEAAP